MKKNIGIVSALIIPIALLANKIFVCACIIVEETTILEKLEFAGLNRTWPLYAIQVLLMIAGFILWRSQTKVSRVLLIITSLWLILFFTSIITI